MNPEPKNRAELLLRIQLLEAQQKSHLIALETEVHGLAKSFHPLNLIKSTLQQGSTFESILELLKGSVLGAGSGFVASKLFGRQEGHPLRRMLGSAAIMAVTNLVLKNPAAISTGLGLVVNFIKNRTGKNKEVTPEDFEETA